MDFAQHGAQRVRAAVHHHLAELLCISDGMPQHRPGIRLFGTKSLRPYLEVAGSVGGIAASILGQEARAVRAVFFDKSDKANWALGWHQDRTICVKHRVELDGFGPWTTKRGQLHVAPPFELLRQMVTLRVHLDPVHPGNAPLLIAPGSHRLGRVAEADIKQAVATCGTHACLADAGDVWIYATPILHASEAAVIPMRRRVLQVDFAACRLPGGLEWSDI